jgi:hypothetical protein
MTELNKAAVTDAEWKKFIKDIVKVQDKHGLTLVPTFKLRVDPFRGVQYDGIEWGAVRDEKAPEKA